MDKLLKFFKPKPVQDPAPITNNAEKIQPQGASLQASPPLSSARPK